MEGIKKKYQMNLSYQSEKENNDNSLMLNDSAKITNSIIMRVNNFILIL